MHLDAGKGRRMRAASDRPAPLFGVNIDPSIGNLALANRIAELADQLELEFAGIQDHPYIATHLDTWTLLTALAARTRRVRFLPNVLNLPLRPPAVLAKAAATLDAITGGRFEMGLGAGGYWDGIAAYGGQRRTPAEAVDALDEAIHIMRLLWDPRHAGQDVSFAGAYYRLDGARPGPSPAHPIGIWLGALKPRMLELTGARADGWLVSVPYAPPEVIPAMQARIDAAATQSGRNTTAIRRGYNLMGVIDLPGRSRVTATRPGTLVGPPDAWVDTIARYYRELGMDTFFFWPLGGAEEAQIEAFAKQVIPGVRQALGLH